MSPTTADPTKNRGLAPNVSRHREARNRGTLLTMALLVAPMKRIARQVIKTGRLPSVVKGKVKKRNELWLKLNGQVVEYATPQRLPTLPAVSDKLSARLHKGQMSLLQ